VAQVAVKLAA